MATIISKPHVLDVRNPEFLSQVTVTGDVGFAILIGVLARAPSPAALEILRTAEQNDDGRLCELRRIDRPAESTVVQHLHEGIPFVATNCLEHGAWCSGIDELVARFGRLEIRELMISGGYETFEDVVSQMTKTASGRGVYTSGCPLPLVMCPFFQVPFFNPEVFCRPQLWMGAKSHPRPCTELHRDTSHGFLGQVVGRKEFVLYSPSQARYLYPCNAFNLYQPCWVDPFCPDEDAFPLFKHARPIRLMLHPGELLVNPAGWFHYVVALDAVVSVSCFMNWQAWTGLRGTSAQSAAP
jgi:hypothetical protein